MAHVEVGNLLIEWSHQSASGPGCWLDGGYYRPVCVETVVGPLHHYRRRGVADNNTVLISDEYVCCSVVFGTLVGVFVFSVMWSELLITSTISRPLWSSVYECQTVEHAFPSPVRTECGMFVMYCMQCCMSVSAVFSAWM